MKAISHLVKHSIVLCASLIVSVAATASYAFTLDKVLAVVDQDVITLSDYLLFAKSMGVVENMDVINEALLKKLMEEKVILHEANRRGIEVSDAETDGMIEEIKKESAVSQSDLERELAKEGMNFSGYRKIVRERLIALKLIGADVDSKVIVTEEEIETFYRENIKEYLTSPAQVEVKAIFLRLNEGATVTEITDLKRKALRIAAQLGNGENFELLADRYNDEDLRGGQGRLGEFLRGALIPQLDRKVFSMQKGEISGPIWVKEGAYIVKLVNRTDDAFKTLEEARIEIYKRLFTKKREKIFNEWVRSLWRKAFITIN
jgi:peptidyl-prolyl cis-trans isomerase SurA